LEFRRVLFRSEGATGLGAHGISYDSTNEYEKLKLLLGRSKHSEVYKDLPSIETDRLAAEAVLRLSSATTGSLAMKAWKSLEEKSGRSDLQKLVADRAGEDI